MLCVAAVQAEATPNVIVIMADDFGYECVAANGGESYATPHLDRMAAQGMRFEHFHVQPLCTPTRAQLMTGMHNIRNYINFGTLNRESFTFGNAFQQAGYDTGICGKWQLGREPDSPQHFGFAESLLWQHTRRPPRYANPGLEKNAVEQDFNNGEYGPDLVNEFALEFVSRRRDKPFFLYYPMMLTHGPYQPTPDSADWDPQAIGEDVNKHERHFGEMVTYMDKLVGRLLAKLKESGIDDNTLVVFLGDNGTGKGTKSRFQGAEYIGGKGQTNQYGTHVPLIVRWPAKVKPGVNRDLVSGTDIFPTICAAAGVSIPDNLDGHSCLPQLMGEKGSPREWLYSWYSPRQQKNLTVREFAWNHDYKLYRTGEFYGLKADPKEQHPLDANQLDAPAKAAREELQAALDQYTTARPAELDRLLDETPSADPDAIPPQRRRNRN